MSLLEKFKDGFWSHIGSASGAALTIILGWLFYQITPALLPALEAIAKPRVIMAILLLSVVFNIVLVTVTFYLSRPAKFKLKFGILWDQGKNPHCPSCKNAGLRYGEFNWGELGYFCNTCKDVFHLADAEGKDIKPNDALAQF